MFRFSTLNGNAKFFHRAFLFRTTCTSRNKRCSYHKHATCISFAFPPVSEWTSQHLQYLGLKYDDRNTELPELFENLKDGLPPSIRDEVENNFPKDFIKTLQTKLEEDINFTFELRDLIFPGVRDQELKNIKDIMNKINDFCKNTELQHKQYLYMNAWYASLVRFARVYYSVVKRAKHKDTEEAYEEPLTEKWIEYLLNRFLEIFLLEPGPGTPKVMTIWNDEVESVPACRFIIDRAEETVSLFLISEVKLKELTGDCAEPFKICNPHGTNSLEQHAGELMVERPLSLFSNGVMGIMCFETQVIFTFMNIGRKRYLELCKGKGDNIPVQIMYTKPYNFLHSEDRSEIAPFLFWLGFVQNRLNMGLRWEECI